MISFYEILTEVIFRTEKKRLGNIFETQRFFFCGSENKIYVKVVEEYCWAIPQAGDGTTVMLLPIRLRFCEFKSDSNSYTQVFDYMCSQLRLVQNSTCARPSVTSLLTMIMLRDYRNTTRKIHKRIPKVEFRVKCCIRKVFTVCTL